MKNIGLALSFLAVLSMSILSSGTLYADVVAVKGAVSKKLVLSEKDAEYFAKSKSRLQVAGSDEDKGFLLLGGTILMLALIVGAAALTIHK